MMGMTYNVDGIDDKLTTFTNQYNGKTFLPFKLATACVDDMSSDWPASFLGREQQRVDHAQDQHEVLRAGKRQVTPWAAPPPAAAAAR